MQTESWKGEHLIRCAPRPAPLPVEEVEGDDIDTILVALRRAARAGERRVVIAAELGITYNRAVFLCIKHGISFADPRKTRRPEGGV